MTARIMEIVRPLDNEGNELNYYYRGCEVFYTCPHCGTEIDGGYMECFRCGYKLPDAARI